MNTENNDSGIVYVLTNPAMPGLVNIGLVTSSIFAIGVGIIPNVKIEYSYGTIFLSIIFLSLGLMVKEKTTAKKSPTNVSS